MDATAAEAARAHVWEDTLIGCDDCGEHPAVRCVNPDCPCDGDPVDLIYQDDPREGGSAG